MLDLTPTGLRLHTSATLANCADLLRKGQELWAQLPQSGPIIIEFDSIARLDSSLLALLLNWQERAHAESRQLELRNAPANLQHLASLYGVDNWINGLTTS